MTIIQAQDKVKDALPGGPLRFAYPVKVHYTLANSGVWQTLEDGSKLWRLKVRLPGALSTNALYDKFRLPKGAKFYVYSEETRQSIGGITSEYLNNESNSAFAFSTGLIYGETVTFEYYQPETVREEAIISISRIDYGYRYVNSPYTVRTRSFDDSGDCQVNVNCPEGADWRMEKDAISRIMVVSDYGSGWCSCSLVNNTNNDNTPYVLTADHCLQNGYGQYLFDAISNPNASQWVFYWGYEHPGCSDGNEPAHRSTVGATVVANNGSSDFALLRLTQDPRNLTGFTPYYLGWDRSGNSGTSGVGIHHPSGDVKKISTLNRPPQDNWNGNNKFWSHYWNATPNGYSVTEGGSSGSPLINNSHHIIGQLYGGSSIDCFNPSQDIAAYGKFSVSWTGNGTTDSRRRLRDWLDPLEINPQTLNGIGVPELPIPWNATINGIWTSPVSGEPLVAEVNPSLYDADEYIWYIDGNEIERTSTNYLSTYNWICKPKQEVFWVIGITSRGPTVPIISTYTPLCTHPRFTLSPNPAGDVVTLRLMETDRESGESILSTARSVYEIQLWSGMTMLRSYKTNEPTFQIPVAGLPAGLYFVRVVKDGEVHTEKLIKN